MKYTRIDSQLFVKNRKKIADRLENKSVAIFFSSDIMIRNGNTNFSYRQDSNLFYLSGIDQEKTVLVVCPDYKKKEMREILFVIRTDKKTEVWEGEKLSKKETKDISGVSSVYWVDDFYEKITELINFSDNIYFDYFEEGENKGLEKSSQISIEIRNKFPKKTYLPLNSIMKEFRIHKEFEEVQLIKTACEITKKAFSSVLDFVKPGCFEYEVEAEIIYEFIKNGANGHAYLPIIASGKNACVLHYVKNTSICEEGNLLLMDFGAEYGNYAADCSRTIPVSGVFSKRQKECYESVLRVMKAAIKMMRPGKTIKEIHSKTCKLLEEEMVGLSLFTKSDVENQPPNHPLYLKYYMHGTSHFIGLDVHDVGEKIDILAPGMILSCEPAIYIKEENIGIRLENVILITEDYPVDLMENIPIEPDEIENLMSKKKY